MKKYFKCALSFILAFTLLFSNTVFATGDFDDFDDLFDGGVSRVEWLAKDFVIEGNTIYGFSKSGIEKLKKSGDVVLPKLNQDGEQIVNVASFAFVHDKNTQIDEYTARPGENGEVSSNDVDGNEIKKLGEEFNLFDIKSVTIPDGYRYIGSDAFAFNKKMARITLPDSIEYISEYGLAHNALERIKLPSSLTKLGDQAFFDNKIEGELVIPKNFKTFGERSFKGNKISNIVFEGNKVTSIPEQCFQDNQLTNFVIPTSIERIANDAFSGNIGDENYGNFVVLRTADGTNPHNLPNNSIYINPTDDLRTVPLDIDYTRWTEKDFIFDGSVVKGFSQIGEIKVRKNKELEIPAKNGEIAITEIGAEAFRNVDFDSHNLKKYDLVSVVLPETVETIGDYAFQSNYITEFEGSPSLKVIGKGAFMNNKIDYFNITDSKVEIIDDAAFHINEMTTIIIPNTVEKIGTSAFRQNGAIILMFMGDSVEEIKEMAFSTNALTEVDLSLLTKLKKIDVQTFISNKIASITLPENLMEISEEAFKHNNLQKVSLPKAVNRIAFNAFDENENVVDVEVVDGVNINKIPDGDNFIVNKDEMASNRTEIEEIINKINALDLTMLRDATKKHFESIKADGEVLLSKEALREGEKLKYIFEANFFMKRINLDKLIKAAQVALTMDGNETNKKLLNDKLDYALRSYNNSALTEKKLTRLESELSLLTDLVKEVGEISKSSMIQGHYILDSPLPIPSYHIGVNVYFNNVGKILYVLDMSYTIGEGQNDEYGNPILNVDEDNEGYHILALDTLSDYEGLSFKDIINNDVNTIGVISNVEKAMYHREGIYKAVKDAALDYAKTLKVSHSNPDSSVTVELPNINPNLDNSTIIEKPILNNKFRLNDGLKLDVSKVENTMFTSMDLEIFDINFMDEDGQVVKLDSGEYKVTIKKSKDNKVINVYYIDEENNMEAINFEEIDGNVVFRVKHFSKYAIEYGKDEMLNSMQDESEEALSKTGYSGNSLLYTYTMLVSIFAVVLLARKRKENNN